MSDNARESLTDKASRAMKPDSQKSGTEQLTDSLKSKADSVASAVQPESQKSHGQKTGDAFASNNSGKKEKTLIHCVETKITPRAKLRSNPKKSPD